MPASSCAGSQQCWAACFVIFLFPVLGKRFLAAASLVQKCCSNWCTKLQNQKHFTCHDMGTTFLDCTGVLLQLEPVKQER